MKRRPLVAERSTVNYVKDTLTLIALASASSFTVGFAGLILLHTKMLRSHRAQVAVVGLTGVVAVALGSSLASRAMFISSHDLKVLGVVLAAGMPAAITVSIFLADQVTRRSGQLERARIAETARRELIGLISNDLREPLLRLRSLVQLDSSVPQDVARNVEQLLIVTGDLVDLSEAGTPSTLHGSSTFDLAFQSDR